MLTPCFNLALAMGWTAWTIAIFWIAAGREMTTTESPLGRALDDMIIHILDGMEPTKAVETALKAREERRKAPACTVAGV